MAWLLVPGLGLVGLVSVFTASANAAVQARSTAPEVPEGLFGYTFTLVFLYPLYLSMTINAMLLTFRVTSRPLTGVPTAIGLGQLGLYVTLALWLIPLRLEFLGIPVGALGLIEFIAPFACVFLSIYVFVLIMRGPRIGVGRLHIRPAHLAFAIAFALAGIAALFVRWLVPLNATGLNAANWALVATGLPWSVPATIAAWFVEPMVSIVVRPGDLNAWITAVSGITLSIPVLANIGLTVGLFVSSRLRRGSV